MYHRSCEVLFSSVHAHLSMPVTASHVGWQLGFVNVSQLRPAGQSAAVIHVPGSSGLVNVSAALLLLLLPGAAASAKPLGEHMLNCSCRRCCCCFADADVAFFAAAAVMLLLPGALQLAWHIPRRAHSAPGRCSSPGLFAVSAIICSQPGRICCSRDGSVPIAVDRQKPCKRSSVQESSAAARLRLSVRRQAGSAAPGKGLCPLL
jgi:hypothetical protein